MIICMEAVKFVMDTVRVENKNNATVKISRRSYSSALTLLGCISFCGPTKIT